MIRPILLALSAAVASGLLFVNMYNSIVDAPNWGADLPHSVATARQYFSAANPGDFFRIVSPLNQVLAVIVLVFSWKSHRYLGLAFLVTAVLLDVMTFGYFYPRNDIMFVAAIDENAVRTAWQEWSAMNWFRSALNAINVVLVFSLLIVTVKRNPS
jgi:hypothetical protein